MDLKEAKTLRSDPYGTRYFKCVQRLKKPWPRTKGKYKNDVSPENINKDVEIMKKESEILELKTIITEIRISHKGSTVDLNIQKKKAVNLDKFIEIIKTE